MIVGMIPISVIAFYLNSYQAGRLIGYTIGEQLRDISSYLFPAAAMGGLMFALGKLPIANPWAMLSLQCGAGLVSYMALAWMLRLMALRELWDMALHRTPLFKRSAAGRDAMKP